jgi:phospholipid/cholesterol/gamma-HCH transport system substrate-binding protein
MASKTNPKLIGGFVVGAIVLVLIGVIAFGGGKFLAAKRQAVLFFSESSLAGLDVGSPVTFRGVKIGSVTGIVIRFDADQKTLQIPVFIEVDLDKIQVISGHRDIKNMAAMVERGLRAQLVVQSLVTGQASINFDFHPGTPVALLGTEPGMIELPTVPSDIDVLKANLTSLLQRISALPLDQIANQMLGTVGSANELVKNLNAQMGPLAGDLRNASQQATLTLKEAQSRLELREGEPMQNLNATLLDARKLVNDVDGKVDPLAGGLEKLMKSVLVTLDRAQLTLQSAQGSLSPDSALYFELNRTLRDVQSMADSIHAFADYMQRHPDALLTGKRQP